MREPRFKMKFKNKNLEFKKTAVFEIAVLIFATISFSYFAHISDSLVEEDKINAGFGVIGLTILKVMSKILFSEKTLVSALEEVHTCMVDRAGKTCQAYFASACNNNCTEPCVPMSPDKIEQCKAGTCFDSVSGICSVNTLKVSCSSSNLLWFDNPNGNIAQCKRGCCLNSGNAWWSTERECQNDAEIRGLTFNFKTSSEIKTELACIMTGNSDVRGACITGKDALSQKNNCVFGTSAECLQRKGDFHAGYLCSAEELNTVCEKQKTAKCVSGKDEVYWFDGCNNPENIYDANKVRSWNSGKVQSKSESCSMGSNGIANQGTCGNCDRTVSSACGDSTSSEKLSDLTQKFVCRNLGCVDEKGGKRENGETWCFYQGAIGVSEDGLRAMDTPGSEHYVKICVDGEVRNERCGNYREGVCVESQTTRDDGSTYSNAMCQPNAWMECIAANLEDTQEKRIEACTKASYACFVKSVNVGSDFSFQMCAPKYPVGHNLNTQVNKDCASSGSQRCKTVYVKNYKGELECKAGCKCDDTGRFFSNMNDLCTSLGDCGGEVNYMGTYSPSYSLSRVSLPGASYFDEIKSYDEIIPGKVADPFDAWEYSGALAISAHTGDAQDYDDFVADQEAYLSNFYTVGELGFGILPMTSTGGLGFGAGFRAATGFAKFGNAMMGAAIAAGATAYLMSSIGITPGLSQEVMDLLLYTAAIGGALVTMSSAAGPYGLALLVFVAVVMGFMKWAGVGKAKKRTHIYTCESWAPAAGGDDCNKCGSDGVPCSPYACSSLGTKCQLVNGDTDKPECINQGPDDIAPPVLGPLIGNISNGYAYADAQENGFKIKSDSGDGCVEESSVIAFGLQLDKYGRCRFDIEPNTLYADMPYSFGLRINKDKQTEVIPIPSMEDLGATSYNPDTRADFNLYIRCENINGKKRAADYVVNFCVKPTYDVSAPLITAEQDPIYAKSDADKKEVKIFTNEPAECKWSEKDEEYSTMPNNFACENYFEDMTINGWECKGNVSLRRAESTIFTRCLDKPWEENQTARNANKQSVSFRVIKTQPLTIVSATPDSGIISSNVNPTTVKVEVSTSGGLSNGESACIYSFDDAKFTPQFEIATSSHVITPMFFEGKHKVGIMCEDLVGNSAGKNISFGLSIDDMAPAVTRVYANAGMLTIKTSEPAECAISEEKCAFTFANGTLMSGVEFEHTSSVERNKVYYIRCKDALNNTKGECDKTVKVISGLSQGL